MESAMPPQPFTMLSWPPKPAITRGLIFVRVLLWINNFITCAIAFRYNRLMVIGAIGVLAAVSLPFVMAQMYLHYRMLPSSKNQQHGFVYSALGVRGEAVRDHHSNPIHSHLKPKKATLLYVILGLDLVGWLTFLLIYSFTMPEMANHHRWDAIGMSYASVGALVAVVMLSYCIIIEIRLLITRHNALKPRCPHCSHVVSNPLPEVVEGSVRLPDQEAYLDEPVPALGSRDIPTTTESSSGSVREAEGYSLINKA